MGRLMFVEVVDRRGRVVQRVRVDALPFRIGRAYSNDLILDDRFVCPEHLQVARNAEGQFMAEDLGSANGVFDADSGARIERVRLDSRPQLRLGRTLIRFRDAEDVIEPTVVESRHAPIVQWATDHWSAALLMLAVLLGARVLESVLGSYREISQFEVIGDAAVALLAVAGWAGAWALVSRLLGHPTRLVAHWMTVSGCSLAAIVLAWALNHARFRMASINAVEALEFSGEVALLALLLFGNLTAASVLRKRRRQFTAALVALSVLGAVELRNFAERPDFVSMLPYWSQLEPTNPAWLPVRSVDQFFSSAASLQGEVDELAAE